MSEILERERERVRQEQTREEHNAHIGERYRRMMSMDYSAAQNDAPAASSARTEYSSIASARPVFERPLTFEQVEIPEELQRPAQKRAPEQKRDRYAESVCSSPSYRAAVFGTGEREEEESELSRPTGTTLQYLEVKAEPTVKTQKAESAVTDLQRYYASVLKNCIVVFAVAFVVVMAVIAINSAVLGGLDLRIADLQQTYLSLTAQYNGLLESIAQETGWESILAFIEANGMIVG